MARGFSSVNTEYFNSTNVPITVSSPFTFAVWCFDDVGTATNNDRCIFQIGDSTKSNGYFRVGRDDGTNNNFLRMQPLDGLNNFENTVLSTGYTNSTWFHVCCTVADDTGSGRTLYLDGGNEASGTTTVDWDTGGGGRTPNRYALGREDDSSPGDEWDGYMAEFGFWDRALSAAEVQILAAGYSPLFIPRGLVRYFPLNASSGNERCVVSGDTLTENGTIDAVDHPRIILPSRPALITPPGAAPPDGGPDTPQGLHGIGRGFNPQRATRLGGEIECRSGRFRHRRTTSGLIVAESNIARAWQ